MKAKRRKRNPPVVHKKLAKRLASYRNQVREIENEV